jgi:hypothetical protein
MTERERQTLMIGSRFFRPLDQPCRGSRVGGGSALGPGDLRGICSWSDAVEEIGEGRKGGGSSARMLQFM